MRKVGVEPTCNQTNISTAYQTEGIFAHLNSNYSHHAWISNSLSIYLIAVYQLSSSKSGDNGNQTHLTDIANVYRQVLEHAPPSLLSFLGKEIRKKP